MKLYCKDGIVVATHGDDQQVPASAYGDGVTVIAVPDSTVLEFAPGDEPHRYLAPAMVGAVLAEAVKSECSRRIFAVLKDVVTQTNINSYLLDLVMQRANGGALSVDQATDVATARALKAWVEQMQSDARAIIAGASADFGNDAHWTPPPAGGRDFANRF